MTHHSVDALPMGEFLISARRKLTRPRPGLPGVRVGEAGWMWEDSILRIDPQGRIIGEISLLERLFASGLEALLYANGRDSTRLGYTDDPLHLNNVEALPEEIAAAFPLFAAGDIIVSMRNLNTIAVLDRKTFLIKWWMTGPFLRQHDPDFLPNGHILVFDNRKGGREQEFGFSRILEIDPVTRQVVWSYGGSDREPFYTDALGKQQPLANGNILVVEAQRGRVFEVSRSLGGRIVWEWINRIDDELVGVVTQAERIAADQVSFLGGACP
jgi:Arylsulfotransferase (ASST)